MKTKRPKKKSSKLHTILYAFPDNDDNINHPRTVQRVLGGPTKKAATLPHSLVVKVEYGPGVSK